jgi:hypothetical protein
MRSQSLLVTFLVTSLALVAFSGNPSPAMGRDRADPLTVFPHRVSTTHVTLYWDCQRPEPGLLRLDGVAQNPYFSDVRFLELELVGVDAMGRAVSHTKAAVSDLILRTRQFSPFRLDLRPVGREVRFDLFYNYRAQENLRSSEGHTSIPVVGAATGRPWLLAQSPHHFMAMDVCSKQEHSAPKAGG